MNIQLHMAAFLGGFLLDLAFGDPCWLPHPIRWIGTLISGTETRLRKAHEKQNLRKELLQGVYLVLLVLMSVLLVSSAVLMTAYRLHPFIGLGMEMIMTYQILAAKCLKTESMKVFQCLKNGDLIGARYAVSMIVGRDTAVLEEEGVAKAAIETVAENTSDGVVAPMICTAIGGPVLGYLYKAVNTMDSMVGYKNERYLYFGRAAAKLDDIVNYIPARISAWLMILAAFGCEFCDPQKQYYSGKRAYAVWRRDNRKHASPNSAQTEAACAGALGIRLAGDASYFGKTVKKPYIGDANRPVEYEDIRRASHLMYGTAWLCLFICLSLMACAGI